MQTFSINLQNIINLFTHVKNIHAVFNSNASLILLIILTWLIYAICAEVITFKAKKSTLEITLLICLVIMIGCVFIFNQSVINWMNQSLSTIIVQVVLGLSCGSTIVALHEYPKDKFIGNWIFTIILDAAIIGQVVLAGVLFPHS